MKNHRKFLGVFSLFFVLVACSSKEEQTTVTTNGRISPIYQGPSELSYCSLPARTFSGSTVTISGNASFQARTTNGSGLGSPGSAQPIRYAEVRVTNSSGTIVQCAETDNSGNFSFALPQGSSSYNVAVNARANNSKIKVSVLDAPETNSVYALTTSVVPSSSQSLSLVASATGDVLGGAFNIYEQIVKTNDFFRLKLSNCSAQSAQCTDFTSTTSAPKVSVYWELGFNPGSYYSTGGVSFYLPGYSRLFILGGVNGDYNNSDTDHFDNAIIIHEYGHFIEDVYSVSDSPGGSHSGNKMIDARLAWSEGFANFLNAVVRAETALGGSSADATYLDTIGNVDGSTALMFNIDLESYAGCSAGCDLSTEEGEGIFREFAITRFLYDAVDSDSDTENSFTDNVSGKFDVIWAALTTSDGFKRTDVSYRDIGLLNFLVHGLIGDTTWGNIRQMHGMVNDTTNSGNNLREEYAQNVATGGGCNINTTPYEITPKSDIGNEHPDSNLYRNNEFFMYRHSGGSFSLVLNYVTPSPATEADLDLYVFDAESSFVDTPIGKSEGNPSATKQDTETETITFSSLAAGDYLINIHAYFGKGFGVTTDFELLVNGVNVCRVNLTP